jgi:thioredoxin-related protein
MFKLISVLFFIKIAIIAYASPKNFNLRFNVGQEVETGIKWTDGLTWQEVKEKAQKEKKYIFVDAYATWCGPCKLMDKKVYTDPQVGAIVNEKFIAVRLQMDSSNSDNEWVKKWYGIAHDFKNKYGIDAYPSFLFFTSNGQMIHSDMGYKSPNDFVSLLKIAADTSKQYYTAREKYLKGIRNYPALGYLAMMLFKNKERELATKVAKDYKENYLDTLPDSTLLLKDNLDFLGYFHSLFKSDSRLFGFCFNQPELIDSIRNWKSFAKLVVNAIVTREEVQEKLWENGKPKSKNPDWENLYKNICDKYSNMVADNILPSYKQYFYKKTNNWKAWSRIIEVKIKNDIPTASSKNLNSWGDNHGLNSYAWDAFQYCMDKSVLKKALKWSSLSIAITPKSSLNILEFYDTKANLLYKIGYKNKAINQEEQAIKEANRLSKKAGSNIQSTVNRFKKNLSKMNAGLPTWPVTNERG